MRQAVEALLATMRADELAESTITTNEFRLWHFFQLPRYENKPIRWLRNHGEELYAAAQGGSADTHQAELALAKRVGEICVKRRCLTSNPFEDVEPVGRKTHGSTKPRLRVDESRKLREFCLADTSDQHRVIALAYLLLGARASELVKRDVRDLDDDGRLLWISRTKTVKGSAICRARPSYGGHANSVLACRATCSAHHWPRASAVPVCHSSARS